MIRTHDARIDSPEFKERLKAALEYDRRTGVFRWRTSTSSRARVGDLAGYCDPRTGYLYITLERNRMLAHRIAWMFEHGSWPAVEIDHRDGDGSNNRISNLREATKAENQQNVGLRKDNSTGCTGVSVCSSTGKFKARIVCKGREYALGRFVTAEQAADAYRAAKRKIHIFQPVMRGEAP